MKILNLSIGLTVAGLLAAAPALAQTSTMRPQNQEPGFQNPGGVAGGFASSTSKDTPTKQKTQNLTPTANQGAWQDGNQK